MTNYGILLIPPLTALYMAGGQIEKGIRRFGVPSLSMFLVWWESLRIKKDRLRCLWMLLLIPTLCMGYGVKSWLNSVTHGTEWLQRLIYSFLLLIPFVVLQKWIALLLIPAFQIRAGGFKLGRYDFLWEDLARGSALSLAVCL